MEGFAQQGIERAGISARTLTPQGGFDNSSEATYYRMVQQGWIDGLGRSLDWKHWNSKRPRAIEG